MKTNFTDIKFVKDCLPQRKKDSNKGDYGKVLIIAGSDGMLGAGILCSRAALRAGAGLVYLGCEKNNADILNISTPEVIVTSDLDISSIKKQRFDVIAIGPGIGLNKKDLVKKIITSDIEAAMVLDADALNSISDDPSILRKRKFPVVVTPHPGEMSRLTKLSVAQIQSDRASCASEFSRNYGTVTVLKGMNTVTASPSGEFMINPTGNPGMAAAGMGDVLTGIIVSLLGQKINAFHAAVCGTFIHGTAGDVVSSLKGETGIMASDIIESIPFVIQSLIKDRR